MKKALSFCLVLLGLLAACDDDNSTNPPGVTPIKITSPQNGDVLTDPVTIRAQAGSGYHFTSVDFYIDTVLVFSDSVAPYEYFWDIFAYDPDRLHPVYAIADSGENDYMSEVVLVTIDLTQGFSFAASYQPGTQNARGVTSFGNVLFISLFDAGIEMLDVRIKTEPEFLSRFNTPGQAMHTDVLFDSENSLVLIADRDQGMRSADFSHVDTMIADGVYNTQSLAIDVAVSENIIFLAENDGLTFLEPIGGGFLSQGRVNFPQDIINYVVDRNDTAFVVGNNAFYIIDDSRTIIGTYDNLSLAQAVAVADTFAFIANGNDGVIALSIRYPSNPRFLARFNPNQLMVAVDAGDGVLFAGSESGAVYALNYSVPGQLNEIDRFTSANQLEEIDYNSNYLYTASRSNIDILRFVQ